MCDALQVVIGRIETGWICLGNPPTRREIVLATSRVSLVLAALRLPSQPEQGLFFFPWLVSAGSCSKEEEVAMSECSLHLHYKRLLITEA